VNGCHALFCAVIDRSAATRLNRPESLSASKPAVGRSLKRAPQFTGQCVLDAAKPRGRVVSNSTVDVGSVHFRPSQED